MVFAKQHSTYLLTKPSLWNQVNIQLPQNTVYCYKATLFIRETEVQITTYLLLNLLLRIDQTWHGWTDAKFLSS